MKLASPDIAAFLSLTIGPFVRERLGRSLAGPVPQSELATMSLFGKTPQSISGYFCQSFWKIMLGSLHACKSLGCTQLERHPSNLQVKRQKSLLRNQTIVPPLKL